MKMVSVITPCFNEDVNIRRCYERIRTIFSEQLPNYKLEHIFCDNASQDNTVEILREISSADTNVKVILNARNFGPLRSNYNGVMASSGDIIVLFMPADLQDPPELIPQFIKLHEQGYEVVYGIRKFREESGLMKNIRNLFYRLLTGLSDFNVPIGVGDFQLVDRKVVEAMRQIKDVYPFMRMMTFECGFRSVGVPYTWVARTGGKSKNNLSRLIDMGMNGLVTFSTAPLRLVMFFGLIISIFSILFAIYNFALGLFFYKELAPAGIMTIICGLFFFGGVQLFAIGVISEYMNAVYSQVREKPIVFERERINF